VSTEPQLSNFQNMVIRRDEYLTRWGWNVI
jgi:hypothetical protein